MKKLISLLLALTLALALAVPARAADESALGIIGGADGPTAIIVSGLPGDGAADDSAESDGALAALRAQTVTSLGGRAGETNVLLGERCIAFTDALPEAKDGRTMVPLRATLEAMGATVDYDQATKTAIVTGEGVSFTHVIGSDTIVLGDGSEVRMDVCSYATAANRTMVPVRFFSQVLGYDVFWDNDYKLVFLLDRESWVKSADEQFGILNDFLAKSASRLDPAKNYSEEMKLSGTVRLLDSINGDKSYPYSAKADALVGKDGLTVTLRAELGGLLTLLERFGGETVPAEYRAALTDLALGAILGEKLYMTSPLLDVVMGEDGRTGAWYALSDLDYAALCSMLRDGEGCTVGGLCYAAMLQGDENFFFSAWSDGVELRGLLTALLGDASFTGSGSGYRWHLGLDELAAYMNTTVGAEDAHYTAEDFREAGISELDVTMTLRADGGAALTLALELSQGQQPVVRVDLTASGAQTKSTLRGSVQVRNVCDVSFDGAVTVRATNEEPAAAPPEGATVIDLN